MRSPAMSYSPAMSTFNPTSTSRNPNSGNTSPGQDHVQQDFQSPETTSHEYLATMHPQFTFTTEPSSVDFNNYSEFDPSNDPHGYDGDTSTANNSYSSAYHSNTMQGYHTSQNYSTPHDSSFLSEHPVGQSVSPAALSLHDRMSPGTYGNESVYTSYSRIASPNVDENTLGDQFGSVLHLKDDNNSVDYISSEQQQANRNQIYPSYTSSGANLSAVNGTSHQLMSPSLTNTSSPGGPEEANPTVTQAQYTTGLRYHNSTTDYTSHGHKLNVALQAHSPALTGSPGAQGSANHKTAHLTSPVVRIENYSENDVSPKASDSQFAASRGASGKRSAQHLSPFDEDSSDDEIEIGNTNDSLHENYTAKSIPVVVPERNEDGSWKTKDANTLAGVGPAERSQLNTTEIPSLDEQEVELLRAGKNADVAEWLSHSDVGSDVEDPVIRRGRKNKDANRRRAKSFNGVSRTADHNGNLGLGVHTSLFESDGILGPGVLIDERSELDYEEDEKNDSGSDASRDDSETPFRPENMESIPNIGEDSYFPPVVNNEPGSFTKSWGESIYDSTPPEQLTSNSAMMRFYWRSKELDHVSLAATVGSRRRSESELSSLYAFGGVSREATLDEARGKPKDKRERRPSILGNLISKRKDSSASKLRKGSQPTASEPTEAGQANTKNAQGSATTPKRKLSWSSKGPKVDTNVPLSSRDTGPSSANPSTPSGPLRRMGKVIQRTRSRSDLNKSPGLATLMTNHGGPPMLSLASPLAENDSKLNLAAPTSAVTIKDDDSNEDDDDIMTSEMVIMDLKVRSEPIIPTPEGFKIHARRLNPRLDEYMVDRVTQEQVRRYKRLLEFKVKHTTAVKNKSCIAKEFCLSFGGQPKSLPPRVGTRDGEAPFIGFQITAPGNSDEEFNDTGDGNVVAAQFPPGVPLPPVKILPAEFECPLCFKVKKFYKPSDWTKHVHEDVQPFTCTFPNCGEPKSFKRKADWVRHENERHRQLEKWTCSVGDCTHTCYRKDNFVQHLVREHKLPEPRARTGRSSNAGPRGSTGHADGTAPFPPDASAGITSEDVWALVEKCRRDTTKQPTDEPCRFCGNILKTWKKLTVHLGKHMEQISMPILPLVEQKQVQADTIISPIVEVSQQSDQTHTPNRSPGEMYPIFKSESAGAAPVSNMDTLYTTNMAASRVPLSGLSTWPQPQLQQSGSQQPRSNYEAAHAPRPGYRNGMPMPGQGYNRNGQLHHAAPYPQSISPVPSSSFGTAPVFQSPVDGNTFSGNSYDQRYFPSAPHSSSGESGNAVQATSNVGFGPSAQNFSPDRYQMGNFMPQQQNQYQQYHA